MLDSHARQVVFGPVLTHLTFDRLHLTQAIEERMFFAEEPMVAVFFLWSDPALGPLGRELMVEVERLEPPERNPEMLAGDVVVMGLQRERG